MKTKLLVPTILLCTAIVSYLPIIFNPHLFFDRGNDMTEFFWPIYYFVKNTIFTHHQLPFWNPMFLSGAPLLPDPQAPIFYLPNIIFLALPINSAFIISIILHTFAGGIGTYLLVKKGLNLSKASALFGAILYILSPRFAGFVEAGHFGLIVSMAWLPFAAWAVLMLAKKPSIKWSILLSISLAGLFYTHPTTFVLSAMSACAVFAIALVIIRPKDYKSSILYFILGATITFGLTAIAILPQLEWVPQTNRFLLSQDRDVYPKWVSLKEFGTATLLPWINGKTYLQNINTEKWLSVGLFSAILALVGFTTLNRRLKILTTTIVAGVALIALNNVSPLYNLLLSFDFYVFARVSTRIWFIMALVVPILAAVGFERLQKVSRYLALVLATLVIAELIFINWSKITKPIVKDRQIASEEVLEYLASDNDTFRVFCTTRCFSQRDVAKYGLETIGGYSTLHQNNYIAQAWQLTGAYWNNYTLHLPPIGAYKFGRLDPDYKALGDYNVKYIISPYNITNESLTMVDEMDGFKIYENAEFKPRAIFISSNDEMMKAGISSHSPNTTTITLPNTPGTLKISEVYTNGWLAITENKELNVQETPNRLLAINIPKGTSSLTLKYKPNTYNIGKIITISTLIIITIVTINRKRKS